MDRASALWRKKKASGTFRRGVLARRKELLEEFHLKTHAVVSTPHVAAGESSQSSPIMPVSKSPSPIPVSRSPSPDVFHVPLDGLNEECASPSENEEDEEYYFSPSEDDSDEDLEPSEIPDSQIQHEPFDVFLRKWAIQFNIRQCALKVLLVQLNRAFKVDLPKDPRTFMRTY